MNPNIKYPLIGCISIILLAGMFAAGLLIGWAFPVGSGSGLSELLKPDSPIPAVSNETGTSADLEKLFEPFWQAWQIVHEDYVDQPVDDILMMQGSIRGMLEALDDPHTSYMDPEIYKLEEQSLQGEYEGIGAYIDTSGEYVEIISPITGSPAEAAGLRAGDLIVGLDGEDLTGVSGDVVHSMILGPAGTDVTLTIQRESLEKPFDVTITRAKIIVPSVESKMLEDDLAYVRINIFGEDTTRDLRRQLRDLLKNNPRGMILDLRGNGGGYLDTSIEVVSEFVGEGVVVYEEYGDGQRYSYDAEPGGLATEIPLVVLVDEGTASASEITAGAIQDYERGILVGTTTYGKGSVQNWLPLVNDQGAIRVTIARWLTPDGRQINDIGIQPDYVVEFSEEDIENQNDVQMEKAIELLNDLIAGKLQ
ncbi:MAG: S41 family peptidase [Anaerolineaceae bacterium]|nr:S41 family peptidase [Anaerolineaceae bacterium]MBN2676850.1 S41 family peptidase [Anaerolineaceae bacterium]